MGANQLKPAAIIQIAPHGGHDARGDAAAHEPHGRGAEQLLGDTHTGAELDAFVRLVNDIRVRGDLASDLMRLARLYDEVRAAGLFIYRNDPLRKKFPSIFSRRR